MDYRLPLLYVGLEVQHKKQVLTATVLYSSFARRLETSVYPLFDRPSLRLFSDGENRLICVRHEAGPYC